MDESPYRETPRTPPDPYLAVWAKHRLNNRIQAGVMLGCLIGGVVAAVHFGVWLAAVPFVLSNYYFWFRPLECPRCRKKFHKAGLFFRNPWTDRCTNCALPFGIAKRDVRAERDS